MTVKQLAPIIHARHWRDARPLCGFPVISLNSDSVTCPRCRTKLRGGRAHIIVRRAGSRDFRYSACGLSGFYLLDVLYPGRRKLCKRCVYVVGSSIGRMAGQSPKS
jgi:hypothetical protein